MTKERGSKLRLSLMHQRPRTPSPFRFPALDPIRYAQKLDRVAVPVRLASRSAKTESTPQRKPDEDKPAVTPVKPITFPVPKPQKIIIEDKPVDPPAVVEPVETPLVEFVQPTFGRPAGATLKFHPVTMPQYKRTVTFLKRLRESHHNKKSLRAHSAPIAATTTQQAPQRKHVESCECDACCSVTLVEVKRLTSTDAAPKLQYRTNCSIVLIHSLFRDNGFALTRGDHWNAFWTSGHLKSYIFQGMSPYQKVNQFPRSFECTRKDTLARNIRRLQQEHGDRHFPYFPTTFVLPRDLAEMQSYLAKHDGEAWIVKPAASAQGRGIFVTSIGSSFNGWFSDGSGTGSGLYGSSGSGSGSGVGECDDGVRKFEVNSAVAARYITNPLLIDGCKFDLRLYVAVTSMNPLRIYLHKEGLCRFATEPYSPDPRHYPNKFMHLTNYSINKKSDRFVPGSDDGTTGHKWSLSALRAKLTENGVDVNALWRDIHDLIIKTFIAIEPTVVAAVNMFVPHKQNCYELFGFDVLIDDQLKPWLLEVNFSPSLACDAPLDLAIKADVISELFTLVGFRCHDESKSGKESKIGMMIRAPTVTTTSTVPTAMSMTQLPRCNTMTSHRGVASGHVRSQSSSLSTTMTTMASTGTLPPTRPHTNNHTNDTVQASNGGDTVAVTDEPAGVGTVGVDARDDDDDSYSDEYDTDDDNNECDRTANNITSPPVVPSTTTTTTSEPTTVTISSQHPTGEVFDVALVRRLLSEIPREDAKIVLECLEEASRCGGYQRIFPTATSSTYLHLFNEKRPHNAVLTTFFQKLASFTSPVLPSTMHTRDTTDGSTPLPQATTTTLTSSTSTPVLTFDAMTRRRPKGPTRLYVNKPSTNPTIRVTGSTGSILQGNISSQRSSIGGLGVTVYASPGVCSDGVNEGVTGK